MSNIEIRMFFANSLSLCAGIEIEKHEKYKAKWNEYLNTQTKQQKLNVMIKHVCLDLLATMIMHQLTMMIIWF